MHTIQIGCDLPPLPRGERGLKATLKAFCAYSSRPESDAAAGFRKLRHLSAQCKSEESNAVGGV
jgi:hypothetical protein